MASQMTGSGSYAGHDPVPEAGERLVVGRTDVDRAAPIVDLLAHRQNLGEVPPVERHYRLAPALLLRFRHRRRLSGVHAGRLFDGRVDPLLQAGEDYGQQVARHRLDVHDVELRPLQHVLVVLEHGVGLVRSRRAFQPLGIDLRYCGQVETRLVRNLPEMALRVTAATDDADF